MANRVSRNKHKDTTRLARRARIYRGAQIAVANDLNLSRAHISLVCRGLRTSQRVEKALAEMVQRIERAERKAAA